MTEATNARALAAATTATDSMTLELCEQFCSGYTYWGTEYGRECESRSHFLNLQQPLIRIGYCGNSFSAGAVNTTASDCSFPCAGNSSEYCGAGNRLDVYVLSGTIPTTTASGTPSTTSSVTVSTGTGYPSGWGYYGCYVDGLNGRILNHQQADNNENTLQVCVAACAAAGYTIAGAEYGVECYCDDAIYNGGALAANQADCNMACPGNTAEDCGAGNRLTLFSIGTPQAYAAPAPQVSGLPTGWTYSGCIQ